jgi:hypothetical protein
VLEQNYPNPFNPSTIISYSLPKTSNVSLKVYNVLGELIATLVNIIQLKGMYEIVFDAANLSSGIYFYRLQAGEFTASHKMIFVK